jgi:hypothetical protein
MSDPVVFEDAPAFRAWLERHAHEGETPAELAPGDLARFQAQPAAWACFEACAAGKRL